MTTPNHDSSWIPTYTCEQLFPLAPDPIRIHIEDIAHGLAGRFRFNGHSREWYTVAQHSVEVSRRVPAEDALWGLLHDAAEAYLPDVPRPIKNKFYVSVDDEWDVNRIEGRIYEILIEFDGAEERVLEAVARRFGLRLPLPASVHEADDRELARERRDLFDCRGPVWVGLKEPYPEPLVAVGPCEAEALFLGRFKELRA